MATAGPTVVKSDLRTGGKASSAIAWASMWHAASDRWTSVAAASKAVLFEMASLSDEQSAAMFRALHESFPINSVDRDTRLDITKFAVRIHRDVEELYWKPEYGNVRRLPVGEGNTQTVGGIGRQAGHTNGCPGIHEIAVEITLADGQKVTGDETSPIIDLHLMTIGTLAHPDFAPVLVKRIGLVSDERRSFAALESVAKAASSVGCRRAH